MKFVSVNLEDKKAYVEERDERTYEVISMEEVAEPISRKIVDILENESLDIVDDIEERLGEEEDMELA